MMEQMSDVKFELDAGAWASCEFLGGPLDGKTREVLAFCNTVSVGPIYKRAVYVRVTDRQFEYVYSSDTPSVDCVESE